MANETVLDRFVTEYVFKGDTSVLGRIENRIEKVRKSADAVGSAFIKMGTGMAGASTAALFEFSKIETQQAMMAGLVGVSQEQLETYRKGYSELVDQTGTSVAELAAGMFFIESAGYSGAKAQEVLEVSARASAAGLGEMVTVADLLTDVLGVYGEENVNVAQAGDQLAAAIREGKLEASSLAPYLKQLITPAAALGIEFGELGGLMAVLSRKGMDASKGYVALNGMMSKLLKPSEQGKKKLDEYGISMTELTKAVEDRGLVFGIKMLQTAFGEDTEAMAKFFEDIEGYKGVLAIMNANTNEISGIIDRTINATGSLNDAFLSVETTLAFQMKRTISNFRDALAQVGESLAPMAKQVMEITNVWIDAFQALKSTFEIAKEAELGADFFGDTESVKLFEDTLNSLNDKYSIFGLNIKETIAKFLTLTPIILMVGVALKVFAIALGAVVSALKVAAAAVAFTATAFKALGAALMWLVRTNPIVLAITAAVTAIYFLVKHWDEVVSFFESTTELIAGWIGGKLEKPIQAFGNMIDWVIGKGKELKEWFYDLLPDWAVRGLNYFFNSETTSEEKEKTRARGPTPASSDRGSANTDEVTVESKKVEVVTMVRGRSADQIETPESIKQIVETVNQFNQIETPEPIEQIVETVNKIDQMEAPEPIKQIVEVVNQAEQVETPESIKQIVETINRVDQIETPEPIKRFVEVVESVNQIETPEPIKQVVETVNQIDQIETPEPIKQFVETVNQIDQIETPEPIKQFVEVINQSERVETPESVRQSVGVRGRPIPPVGNSLIDQSDHSSVTNSPKSVSNRLNVENININAPGADAEKITQDVTQELRDQYQTMVEANDGYIYL